MAGTNSPSSAADARARRVRQTAAVARDRERGRATQKRERAQERADELRRQGRAWFYRAVLAILAAIPLAFLTWFVPVVLVAVAVACMVQGTRLGFRANEVLEHV